MSFQHLSDDRWMGQRQHGARPLDDHLSRFGDLGRRVVPRHKPRAAAGTERPALRPHPPSTSGRGLVATGLLKALETLRLETPPSWDASSKTTDVASLEPLATLDRLRHVELFGVVPPDRCLGPLERCRSLTAVRVSHYPKAEVARFYAATGTSSSFAPEPGVVDW